MTLSSCRRSLAPVFERRTGPVPSSVVIYSGVICLGYAVKRRRLPNGCNNRWKSGADHRSAHGRQKKSSHYRKSSGVSRLRSICKAYRSISDKVQYLREGKKGKIRWYFSPVFFSPGCFRFQGRLWLLPHPVPGVGCIPVLAIFETGLVCLRDALFFPYRVMDISTHPALDIFFAHACFFHLIDAVVILLIHLFSSQSVAVIITELYAKAASHSLR